MKYNKSSLKNSIRTKLKELFIRKTGYYIYPKFRVARTLDFDKEYHRYGEDAVFVNLGAGEYFYHPRWKNYDLYEESLVNKIDHFYNYDLRYLEKYEFPEKNVEMFFCAHTFEHIAKKLINKVVERVYESLKPGGLLRVVVPDAAAILKAYDDRDFDYFKPYESWFKKRTSDEILIEDYLVQLIATPKCRVYGKNMRHEKALDPMEIKRKRSELSDTAFLDYLVYGLAENNSTGTDHLNWFTAEKLIQLLSEAGFSEAYKSEFGKSKALVMRQVPLFDETLPYLSLYVEARK